MTTKKMAKTKAEKKVAKASKAKKDSKPKAAPLKALIADVMRVLKGWRGGMPSHLARGERFSMGEMDGGGGVVVLEGIRPGVHRIVVVVTEPLRFDIEIPL